MELGCLLLLLLDPKILSVWTLVSTTQIRNIDKVDSLLDTTTLPNPDESSPDLGIILPLGLIDSTTF